MRRRPPPTTMPGEVAAPPALASESPKITRLRTAEELAAFFAVGKATVKEWAKAKRIPCIRVTQRVVRFDLDAVLRALEESKV